MNRRPALRLLNVLLFNSFLLSMTAPLSAEDQKPFVIEVVDRATKRGVPLVELRTTASETYYTDSNGIVAFNEPQWMNRSIFFSVESPGYEMPEGGVFHGKSLQVVPGETARIGVIRTAIAERLYRVTGAGIYRDSVAAGRPAPLKNPLLNAGVVGSDSVMNAIYKGRIYWFWGDTSRQSLPLGNFHVPGATSLMPLDGGLHPSVGVELEYFVNDSNDELPFAKETARMPGDGPTWIFGLMSVFDKDGQEQLLGSYMKIKPPLEIYGRGLCRWNDEKELFERAVEFSMDAHVFPGGQPLKVREGDTEYLYFANPLPLTRVRARAEDVMDLKSYECFTCLKDETVVGKTEPAGDIVQRGEDGEIQYSWKRLTSPLLQRQQKPLVRSGRMQNSEGLIQLRDRDGDEAVTAHAGSVYWNEYRRRWIAIFTQHYGKSMLGEVWYSEADSPLGPWAYAVRIATHGKYSFYNPKQHLMFDDEGGRLIFFEGTYSHSFSGNPRQTPWYDYNQLMYRLDLSDLRLAIPLPVYRTVTRSVTLKPPPRDDNSLFRTWATAPWFALDRATLNSVTITADESGAWQARRSGNMNEFTPNALFYALPAESENPPGTTVLLHEYKNAMGERYYGVESGGAPEGFERAEKPLCRVWRSPYLR